MQTYHIHINGIVQGVGFRPMVYHIAKAMGLEGYVKNGNDGVHILVNAPEELADLFLKAIKLNARVGSVIISSEMKVVDPSGFNDFSIVIDDNDNNGKQVLLSADTCICSACKEELHDVNNRRHRYPFITCTQCGPRYSILGAIPYERHNTAMEPFNMCQKCREEYHNVADRRFFSQTNSCKDCGIKLSIHDATAVLSEHSDEVLRVARELLSQGKILAVKGGAGYLLLCDGNNAATIQLLRRRKHRPSRPFAILYPNMGMVNANFELTTKEKTALESKESPIVLLYPKQDISEQLVVNNIAPGLKRIGIMLPCSPLLDLIANDFGKPLVATSANISGSPIVYKDEDAIKYLFEIADYIVAYNREIIVPQDDSVVQVSRYTGRQIILRRSRGYAPSFLHYKSLTKASVLATGAFLKSSFTLAVNGNVFVSQFLGSGESYESQQMYKHTLGHWLKLYDVSPEVILADLHPGYFSHQLAKNLAAQCGAELRFIRHHEAHFAAVLGENGLLYSAEPVLGVIWDGTGLGSDGNIWGGEFFKYGHNEMLRCYHFDYFPAIAGDKMALEPRIAALCASNDTWPHAGKLREKFSAAEWENYHSLIKNTSLFTSSVGRIFDAVASLLDVCDKQSYEGEAAMHLQALAEDHVEMNGFGMDSSYFKEGSHYYRIPTASLIQGVIYDIEKGKPKDYIAAKFHYSMVCLIGIVAENLGIERICFSGGVFQNALLADWIQKEYGAKYQLYFHKNLSPNDENISFGQLVYYENDLGTPTTNGVGIEITANKLYAAL